MNSFNSRSSSGHLSTRSSAIVFVTKWPLNNVLHCLDFFSSWLPWIWTLSLQSWIHSFHSIRGDGCQYQVDLDLGTSDGCSKSGCWRRSISVFQFHSIRHPFNLRRYPDEKYHLWWALSVSAIASQLYIENRTLEAICVPDCKDLFYGYRSTVENFCGTTVHDFSGVNQTVRSFLDPLAWAFNVPCLTSGAEYCYSNITNHKNSIEPCSDCLLQYEAAMLGSVYVRQRVNPDWLSSLLSSCSIPGSGHPYSTPTSTQ